MSEIEKKYYKIGEVSKIISINTTTIRFWIDKEFGSFIGKMRRDRKDNRLFTKDQVIKVQLIKNLLYSELYTIAGAKQVIERYESGKIILYQIELHKKLNEASDEDYKGKGLSALLTDANESDS